MPSIPQSLLWISLVVLWLFVLVPMLISKRDAVRRTSDVALATRVLNGDDKSRLLKRRAGRRQGIGTIRTGSATRTSSTTSTPTTRSNRCGPVRSWLSPRSPRRLLPNPTTSTSTSSTKTPERFPSAAARRARPASSRRCSTTPWPRWSRTPSRPWLLSRRTPMTRRPSPRATPPTSSRLSEPLGRRHQARRRRATAGRYCRRVRIRRGHFGFGGRGGASDDADVGRGPGAATGVRRPRPP